MRLRRPAAILITLAIVAASTAALAATQGSQEDPLLTLSYLDKVLRPQLDTQVDQAVAANQGQLQAQLDQAIAGYTAQVDQALASAGAGVFQSKSLAKGESFTPGAGRELLLTSGAATALGTLTDTTAGKTVSAGDKLEFAHLYVTADSASGCKATAASAVMSR